MPDTHDAKRMARALREALAARSVTLTHSQSLELIAQTLGHADWNTLAAAAEKPAASDPVAFQDVIPILRIFDVEKAKAFYIDLLGFQVDWEHRFEPDLPLFMQVSRGGQRLHLSEHHGDATPGASVYLYLTGIDALHAELTARGSHAHIEPGPVPNMRVLVLWDPFANRIRFAERAPAQSGQPPERHVVAAR
ncbi:MAG TPA: glyoxalase superfamily protein [Caulobacteraceae bacterium]|nr:glyoxalase superfamily protein [Caulobacteraceae bacterium]